jgi:hypothetical protein
VRRVRSIYRQRKPLKTALWHLLHHYFSEFQYRYPERFASSHGFFRSVVAQVVTNYLGCGNLKQGFARIRCPDCDKEYLLAFSCRGRWFCPSCHNKKVVQFSTRVQESVLFPVPHRQYVFSIPKILRRFFLYDRKLLGKLSKCASRSLTEFLRVSLGKHEGIPGLIVAIQTFGDYALASAFAFNCGYSHNSTITPIGTSNNTTKPRQPA